MKDDIDHIVEHSLAMNAELNEVQNFMADIDDVNARLAVQHLGQALLSLATVVLRLSEMAFNDRIPDDDDDGIPLLGGPHITVTVHQSGLLDDDDVV